MEIYHVSNVEKELKPRLDCHFDNSKNLKISLVDAINDAMSPLLGLREILLTIAKPNSGEEAYLRIIGPSLDDLEYTLSKWEAL